MLLLKSIGHPLSERDSNVCFSQNESNPYLCTGQGHRPAPHQSSRAGTQQRQWVVAVWWFLPFLFSDRSEIPFLFFAKRLSALLNAALEAERGILFVCIRTPRSRMLPYGLSADCVLRSLAHAPAIGPLATPRGCMQRDMEMGRNQSCTLPCAERPTKKVPLHRRTMRHPIQPHAP